MSQTASGLVPIPSLVVREGAAGAHYEAKFRVGGRQIKRPVGPAWLEPTEVGWRQKAGHTPPGYFDPKSAPLAAAAIAETCVREIAAAEQLEAERQAAGVSFRDVAYAFVDWAENAGGRKPSTMAQHRLDLSEPGIPHKRGSGETAGYIMDGLGDLPAARIEPREIEAVLDRIAATGVTNRTVNRYRAVISAILSRVK